MLQLAFLALLGAAAAAGTAQPQRDRSFALDGTPLIGGVPEQHLLRHASLDCGMRASAMQFAVELQRKYGAPGRFGAGGYVAVVHEALALASLCNQSVHDAAPPVPVPAPTPTPAPSPQPAQAFAVTVFVAPTGSDIANTGSQASPFRTVPRALAAVAAARAATVAGPLGSDHAAAVYLRAGRYHLTQPIEVTPDLSYVTVAGFKGEQAVISGGAVLRLTEWEQHNRTASGTTVWAAKLVPGEAAERLQSMPGLRLNGRRVTLARYPNSDPERDVYPTGWISAQGQQWQAAPAGPAPRFITNAEPSYEPLRRGVYQRHMVGAGGPCSIFNPAVSYWCSEHPSSACPSIPDNSSAGQAPAWYGRPPVGLDVKDIKGKPTLPNAPYSNSTGRMAGATLTAWRPGHWFNYRWSLKGYDAASNQFRFGQGGYQGGQKQVMAASQTQIITSLPFFKNGAKTWI